MWTIVCVVIFENISFVFYFEYLGDIAILEKAGIRCKSVISGPCNV